jgi:hypothetical protein
MAGEKTKRLREAIDRARAAAIERADRQKAEPKKPDKPAKVPNVTVVYSCGHGRTIAGMRNEKCPSCVRKNRLSKKARYRRNRANRLPDGTVLTVRWDAAAGLWMGHLVMPGGTNVVADRPGLYHAVAALERGARPKDEATNGGE